MKRRAAVLLFSVVAAAGLSLPPAGAASRPSGDVVVVDDDPDGGCQGRDADFESIQAAIDDDGTEEGDTVLVCAGIYDETVKVTKRGLHLKGANAFRDPTHQRRRPESIVTHIDREGTVQLRADDVTWNGFTILGVREAENGPGMTTSPSHSGYLVRDTIFEDNGVGLHLGASGEHPTLICRNRFIANNEFATGGYGIFADTRARRAVIAYNQFRRHNGAGVFLADRGGVQRDLLIDHNRSVDDKSFATVYGSSRVRLTSNSAATASTSPARASPGAVPPGPSTWSSPGTRSGMRGWPASTWPGGPGWSPSPPTSRSRTASTARTSPPGSGTPGGTTWATPPSRRACAGPRPTRSGPTPARATAGRARRTPAPASSTLGRSEQVAELLGARRRVPYRRCARRWLARVRRVDRP
jgi:hypothetical protein